MPHEVAVQLVAHFALPSVAHSLFGHVLVVDVLQAPMLLHTDAVVTLPAAQLAPVQVVALSGNVQVLPLVPSHWPWHTPVPPHAAREPTGLPLMAVHLPTEPAAVHDWH